MYIVFAFRSNRISSIRTLAGFRLIGLVLVFLTASFVAAGLLWPDSAQAQAREYYQWEDEDGQVSFGDSPPANAKNIKKFTRSPRPRETDLQNNARFNEQQRKLVKDLDLEKRAGETEDTIDTAKELLEKQRELNEARCSNLRNNLKSLSSGGRVFTTDPETGEKVYMGDEQSARNRAQTQAQINEDCN